MSPMQPQCPIVHTTNNSKSQILVNFIVSLNLKILKKIWIIGILQKVCLMLLVKMQFGRLKQNLLTQNSLERAQRLNLVLHCSGQQNKGKCAGWTATGLTGSPTGLTTSSRVSQTKSKTKMVKPKKPEIGVWKTVESKSRHKHEKKKAKPNKKFPAKSSK